MDEVTDHDGVFLIDKADVDDYQEMYSAQVLRYSCSTYVDQYNAVNFGACKGETFDRVMIVMESLPKAARGYEETVLVCKKKSIHALKYVLS